MRRARAFARTAPAAAPARRARSGAAARGAGLVAIVVLAAAAAAPGARAGDDGDPRLVGAWQVLDRPADSLRITHVADRLYRVAAAAWAGVGELEGDVLFATFRRRAGVPDSVGPGPEGIVRAELAAPGVARVEVAVTGEAPDRWATRWYRPARAESLALAPGASSPGGPPEPIQPAAVDEPPDVIERVQPRYPDDARRLRRGGRVLVRALVGADGRVADLVASEPVAGLSRAATDAVRRWRFTPARAHGRAVGAWVSVPVTFTVTD